MVPDSLSLSNAVSPPPCSSECTPLSPKVFSPIGCLPSEIGPAPFPHWLSPKFKVTGYCSNSNKPMPKVKGYTAVCQYAMFCRHCQPSGSVCCKVTVGRSQRCESCQASKRKCKFPSGRAFTKGPLVYCNPDLKIYGHEFPISDDPTSDYDSGVISTAPSGRKGLMKAFGIPNGGIPITADGWTNHEGKVQASITTWVRSQQAATLINSPAHSSDLSPRAHLAQNLHAQSVVIMLKNEIKRMNPIKVQLSVSLSQWALLQKSSKVSVIAEQKSSGQ
ncbi:hypothetical protein PPACK8108_LOCUS7585 [Phakopsora pachyrhizi]|uniref:Zn(2)-C6 fungal-type domain-containing protein n=1 Tax=Phakopsora pachyrhizi TaxID=170000 RepID=A0AAV0AWN7_PHAPC|nr:hypothetical protein PPACK8108_LOCUS7585 [Phakopsora pachyrhizi]